MDDRSALGAMCPHCGATATRRVGPCSVCGRTVCEHCGNVHFRAGERIATHKECLKRESSGFKMIKFVK